MIRGFVRPGGLSARRSGQFAPERDTRRLDELVARLERTSGLKLDYGSMGPNGGPTGPHPSSDEGLSIATILSFHEYGLGVPERSVIRWVGNAKRREIRAAMARGMRGYLAGQYDERRVLSEIGETLVTEMRKRIMMRIPPPLSDRTMANPDRDRRGIPLLDTEEIYGSLRWAVRS